MLHPAHKNTTVLSVTVCVVELASFQNGTQLVLTGDLRSLRWFSCMWLHTAVTQSAVNYCYGAEDVKKTKRLLDDEPVAADNRFHVSLTCTGTLPCELHCRSEATNAGHPK